MEIGFMWSDYHTTSPLGYDNASKNNYFILQLNILLCWDYMKGSVRKVINAYFHSMSQHYLNEFMQAMRIREEPIPQTSKVHFRHDNLPAAANW